MLGGRGVQMTAEDTGEQASMRGTDRATARARPAQWRAVVRSAGARLLVLPVSALLGIVVTRLLIDTYGPAAFAQYALLVGIGALLPFTDLGMSAAVTDAVAASPDPSRDDALRRTLLTALRVLLVSMVVLALLSVLVSVLGLWPTLLGDGLLADSGPTVATACLLLIALGIPVGIGQRMLVGLGRNHVSILVLGVQTPLVLAVLALLVACGSRAGGAFPAVPYAVTLVLTAICTWLAARRVRPVLGEAIRLVPRVRTERGAPVFHLAWPMLVQMVAVPLAMQSDRLLLSHLRPAAELAEYSLAAQMFIPIWALVNSAGLALWPVFARARAEGTVTSPFAMAWTFAGAAAVTATAVAALSHWLAELASGGAVQLGRLLVLAFVVLMVVQAGKYPLGMFLTDARGLRFQAAMIAVMLPVNVALSWVLTVRIGPAGPVIGSIVGVLVFEVVANALYVRRRLREAAEAPAQVPVERQPDTDLVAR
jgi:O-antigen/teichoic acid export membrane protein